MGEREVVNEAEPEETDAHVEQEEENPEIMDNKEVCDNLVNFLN